MPKVSIGIDVADRHQAESFYVDALECEHVRNPYPHMAVLSAGDVEIWLVEKPAGSDPLPSGGSVRSYERHWTPVHLDFYVDDIAATLDRVLNNRGSHEKGEEGSWAFCADPFGNGFCLNQNK
jgi:predicted enzyme related to lactoylglutathione lyase